MKDDGGSAFPVSYSSNYPNEIVCGMTVRDYFAAKALQASYGELYKYDQFKQCAKAAYEMADINSWHSVRPLNQSVMSIMVTGKPWNREMPKLKANKMSPLSAVNSKFIFDFFKGIYVI